MNAESKMKELSDELKALKTAYAQVPYNLILYSYSFEVPIRQIGKYYFVDTDIVFNTYDGSNSIVTIEGATFERMPYNGGAKFYLYRKIGGGNIVTLYSIQKGTVTVL